MAELFYSVVMALDSVAVEADIELGGLDQLLNLQMCRRVMAIHGPDAATAARAGFRARFSRKRFSDVVDVPVIDRSEHAGTTVAELFVEVTGQVPSMNRVRRTARDGGLRLVAETSSGERESVSLTEDDARLTVAELAAAHASVLGTADTRIFIRSGRSLLELR